MVSAAVSPVAVADSLAPRRFVQVADRSIALAQWSVTPDANLCSHIMMIEARAGGVARGKRVRRTGTLLPPPFLQPAPHPHPTPRTCQADYLFVRAVPRYALPPAGHAMGFHFGYISPDSMGAAPITKRYVPGADPADVPQTGNAPQLMTGADFRALMPAWAAMHARLEADPEAVKEFNWVRDMYSYSYATMERAVVHHVPLVPFNPLMVQPPADVTLGEACSASRACARGRAKVAAAAALRKGGVGRRGWVAVHDGLTGLFACTPLASRRSPPQFCTTRGAPSST